jgi:hypothetical protein
MSMRRAEHELHLLHETLAPFASRGTPHLEPRSGSHCGNGKRSHIAVRAVAETTFISIKYASGSNP